MKRTDRIPSHLLPRTRLVALAAAAVLAGACTPPASEAETGEPASAPAWTPSGRPSLAHDFIIARRSAGEVGVLRQGVTIGDGAGGAHIVYLNFDGATVTATNWGDDSAANQSAIAQTTRTIPAFDAAPYAPTYTRTSAIDAVVARFREHYARYNVEVRTTRPASGTRYTMALVGGTPQSLHGNIGETSEAGISIMDCGNGEETNISFVFSAVLSPSLTGLSRTSALEDIALDAAHEIGHSFGLEHTTNATDIMYPSLEPTMTAFQGLSPLSDGASECGGGSTQDSNARLLANLGPSQGGGTTTPPTDRPKVAFATPKDGSTLPRTVTLKALAQPQASSTLKSFEVTLGGQVLISGTTGSLKQKFQLPEDGSYSFRATAIDSLDRVTSTQLTITVRSSAPAQDTGCASDADCNAGLVCNVATHECAFERGSVPPSGSSCSDEDPCPAGQTCSDDGTCQSSGGPAAQPGEVGGACAEHSDCSSGICATLGSQQFCTQSCQPGTAGACPDGMACEPSGGEYFCSLVSGTTGGGSGGTGCRVGADGRPDGSGLALAWMVALALAVARRRSLAA